MRKLYLSFIAVLILTLAGCGTGSSRSSFKTVLGHACSKQDETLQCVLPPAPKNHKVSVFATQSGIDFAWSCPNPAGHSFGASYVSPDGSKNWTRNCINWYHQAGDKTVAVWESTANRAQQGFNVGFQDAYTARNDVRYLGEPDNRPIDFAVDCDCVSSSLTGYFQGVDAGMASVLHISRTQATQLVGVYGGYYQVRGLYNAGLVGHENWQTYAWSGGLWLPASIAPLEQWLNGNAVDYDRAIAPNYGQWPAQVSPSPKPKLDPYRVYDKTRRHYRGIRASEYNTVKTWDRASCRNPVKRSVCKSSYYHLALEDARLNYLLHKHCTAAHACPAAKDLTLFHRGVREHGISKRLHTK